MPRNPYDELRAIGWHLTNPGLPGEDGVSRWAAYRPYREGRAIESAISYADLYQRTTKRNASIEAKAMTRPRGSRLSPAPGEGDTSDV